MENPVLEQYFRQNFHILGLMFQSTAISSVPKQISKIGEGIVGMK
jgi:hypothetical protein